MKTISQIALCTVLCVVFLATGLYANVCVVDELKYIEILSSHHCVSTKLSSTQVTIIPIRKNQHTGVVVWKARSSPVGLWRDVGNGWSQSSHDGSLTNMCVTDKDNIEYLAIFIETHTGCRDSSYRRLALDESPVISCEKYTLEGKNYFIAKNLRNPKSVGDEMLWFEHNGNIVSTKDTIESTTPLAFLKIINCIGCADTLGLRFLYKEKDFLPYPNPANESISVNTNRECRVELFDIQGRKVFANNSGKDTQVSIPTRDYPSGMYVLRVCNTASVVVIEH